MQHDGAEGGAAHPRVRNAHHVLDPLARQLLRDRDIAGLRHARRAERPCVAQHQNVVGRHVQIVVVDACRQIVQVLEDHGAAGVAEQLLGGRRRLHDGTARRQVAAHHRHGAAGMKRLGHRVDDILRPGRRCRVQVFAQRLAVDGQAVEVELVLQLAHHRPRAARLVQVFHEALAGRLEVDQHRRLAAHSVETVEVERIAEPPGHRRDVDDGVGRSANGQQHAQGILEGRRRHDLVRRQALLGQRHGARPAHLRMAQLFRRHRRHGGTARQGHAQGLAHTGHSAGRTHHHAGARRRAQLGIGLPQFFFFHLLGPIGGPEAAAVGTGAQPVAAMAAGHHRPGQQKDGRHIGAGRAHQQRRHRLVAAADQHDGIHRLALDHLLGVDRHLVAQVHAGRMREGLVQRNDRKIHRQTAGQHDAALHRLDQVGHVAVAGVVAAEGIGDADDRPFQRIVGITHGLDEGLAQEDRESRVAVGGQALVHAGLLVAHPIDPSLTCLTCWSLGLVP